jgi:hypothetical protein
MTLSVGTFSVNFSKNYIKIFAETKIQKIHISRAKEQKQKTGN